MAENAPKLGQEPSPADGRDAVHVAVVPMLALRTLQPGERLQHGVVDPFLAAPVKAGQRYWLCLRPGLVTGMRHVWQAPGIDDEGA